MFLDFVSGIWFWDMVLEYFLDSVSGLCVLDMFLEYVPGLWSWILFLDYVSGFCFCMICIFVFTTHYTTHPSIRTCSHLNPYSRNQNTPKREVAQDVQSILLQLHVHIANDANQFVHCRFPLNSFQWSRALLYA